MLLKVLRHRRAWRNGRLQMCFWRCTGTERGRLRGGCLGLETFGDEVSPTTKSIQFFRRQVTGPRRLGVVDSFVGFPPKCLYRFLWRVRRAHHSREEYNILQGSLLSDTLARLIHIGSQLGPIRTKRAQSSSILEPSSPGCT